MSARLLKKVLKEQEAAQQEQQLNSDDDSESPDSSAPARNPFDLLEDDNNDDSDQSDQENSETTVVTSDVNIRSKEAKSNMETISVNRVSSSSVKSKKKKKKKKKIREYSSPNTDVEIETSDLTFENLTLGASSSSHQQTTPHHGKSKFVKVDRDGWKLKKSESSTLQIDPKFLRAENELRRLFGSKVVNSYERSHVSVNPRPMRGGRRGNHIGKKTVLVSPSEHWPRWDGCLSMELLETRAGVHYFRYVHSSSYAQAQRAYEAAKAIHDLNGIASILLNHPYHIDSLITLADYFKFTGEHQMSADYTAKCLYALECAWHPLFTPSQDCQLKYVHDTNKPFFSALFTHMKNTDRRGSHRSALEICKLLLSLDSDDPMGAMFCIDYYALRAEEYAWLEQFAEEYRCDNSLWLFPNFSYSLAVCRFYLERDEHLNNRDVDTGKSSSSDLMKRALMLHPSVIAKLVAKVPLKDRMWTNIVKHSFFASEQTGNPSLDHLVAIYVERSYLVWRLPDVQKLLYTSALLVIEMLKEKGSEARDWACVRNEAFSSEKNEYSHLLVSDFSDSMPTMPPENLQDFVVHPRVGVEHHGQFPNGAENHAVRDVADRNALAVLLESILPWINYGTGDDDHIPNDHPERANED